MNQRLVLGKSSCVTLALFLIVSWSASAAEQVNGYETVTVQLRFIEAPRAEMRVIAGLTPVSHCGPRANAL